MRKTLLLTACCLLVLEAPAALAAPDAMIVIRPEPVPGFQYGNFDNLRFGLSQPQDGATSALFAGRNGISLGVDYNLGGGLAIGLDSINNFKSYDEASYFLSVNPVQLKYRLALPFGAPQGFMPFATAGAGLSLIGLYGDPSGKARGGIGLSMAGGVGALINDALTLELGFGGSRAGAVNTYGLQIWLGTAFDSLGRLPGRSVVPPAPAGGGGGQAALRPTPAPVGVVDSVEGDRLGVTLPPTLDLRPGDELLIYMQDGITVKVARARLESRDGDGHGQAVVLQATEPVRKGYLVRAW